MSGSTDEKGPRKQRDVAAWASAVAAVASAAAAALAVVFSIEQSERERRLISIRHIERFEDRVAEIADYPIRCVEFLSSIEDEDIAGTLLDGPKDDIRFAVGSRQLEDFRVCVLGLNVSDSLFNASMIDENGAENGTIVIQPVLAERIYNFTIDFLNLHQGLVEFHLEDVGDEDVIYPYIEDQMIDDEGFVGFLDFLCVKAGYPLGDYYGDIVNLLESSQCK